MDISHQFRNEKEDEILEYLQSNAFGLLVSQGVNHPEVTHLPYVVHEEEEEWYVYSHMARSNRHVGFLSDQIEHLFVVQGVDHYISSSWYDHENVPTWNYISVHLIGSIVVQEGDEALSNMIRLMDRLEPPNRSSLSMEKLHPELVNRQMQGLVAFRMRVTRVEGAKKLSQNRDESNQNNVIIELEKLNNPKAKAVAEEMRRNQKDIDANGFFP